MTLRFWNPWECTAEVLAWDPDQEPSRFADGIGHNVFELATRLAQRGIDVAVGPDVNDRDVLVVFLPSLLERREQLRLLKAVVRWSSLRIVLVRSDFPSTYSFPFQPSLEVVPNTSSLVSHDQVWLPPLPQRGLVKRAESRGSRLETLAFKGYPENLPADIDDAWEKGMQALGVSWLPDLRDPLTGKNKWHDFKNVDLTLCLRRESAPNSRVGWLRKPATKLINAWCADTIPLIGREPGYLELASPREDSMIVESASHAIEVVTELQRNPALTLRLREGARRRAQQFGVNNVLDQWQANLCGDVEAVPTRGLSSLMTGSRVGLRWALDAARGDRASPIWRAVN